MDWGYCRSLVEKVQDNKCLELAILEELLWGSSSVVSSSLKGEVAETQVAWRNLVQGAISRIARGKTRESKIKRLCLVQ